MFSKTVLALAAVLVAGTSTVAFAEQADPFTFAQHSARNTTSDIRAAVVSNGKRYSVAEKWQFDRASRIVSY